MIEDMHGHPIGEDVIEGLKAFKEREGREAHCITSFDIDDLWCLEHKEEGRAYQSFLPKEMEGILVDAEVGEIINFAIEYTEERAVYKSFEVTRIIKQIFQDRNKTTYYKLLYFKPV